MDSLKRKANQQEARIYRYNVPLGYLCCVPLGRVLPRLKEMENRKVMLQSGIWVTLRESPIRLIDSAPPSNPRR